MRRPDPSPRLPRDRAVFGRRGRPSGAVLTGDLERAALLAVAYGDVFDCPLSLPEVHRYLVGVRADPGEVRSLLSDGRLVRGRLTMRDGYVMLPGRERSLDGRRRRLEAASRLWPDAARYARVIAQLPFVRLVAVTGALATDNVEDDADIDYLVATVPRRLWLTRALVIAVVRWAAARGVVLCPNYVLATSALELEERDLFTAHELAQMVPLAGMATYWRMRRLNRWSRAFLPNAGGTPRPVTVDALRASPATHAVERALAGMAGGLVERWEMARKLRKFRSRLPGHPEAAFAADWCKGHFDGHGGRILAAFVDRLRELGLPLEAAGLDHPAVGSGAVLHGSPDREDRPSPGARRVRRAAVAR